MKSVTRQMRYTVGSGRVMKTTWYQISDEGFKAYGTLWRTMLSSEVNGRVTERLSTTVYNGTGEVSVCSRVNLHIDERDW